MPCFVPNAKAEVLMTHADLLSETFKVQAMLLGVRGMRRMRLRKYPQIEIRPRARDRGRSSPWCSVFNVCGPTGIPRLFLFPNKPSTRRCDRRAHSALQPGVLESRTRSLGPVMEHALDAASDRVLWMRLLDLDSNVLAQRGSPQGTAQVPPHWWDRVEKHERPDTLVDTPEGKALVVMLPLRIPRSRRTLPTPGAESPIRSRSCKFNAQSGSVDSRGRPPDDRHTAYVLELAISLKAVASAFEGLRQNLIVGLIASIALLVSVAVIALRAPHYFRGKYLESELELARRVQSDLQPKPHSLSAHVDFAASAVAADHVGGDFYDIFEAESGRSPLSWVMSQVKEYRRHCWSVCSRARFVPRRSNTNLLASGSTVCCASEPPANASQRYSGAFSIP
jgi:hypothetical protein